MVYARTEVLPAPPLYTAHMESPTKPPVWSKPKSTVNQKAFGRSGLRSTASSANMKMAPTKVRRAANVKGSA